MCLLGAALTRLLATAAAFATVTAGLPHVQCVCPDGRVKLFCPGPIGSGCCCRIAPPASGPARAEPNCCRAVGGCPGCCARVTPAPLAGSAGDEQAKADGCRGCVRTVVADPAAYAAEDAGDAARTQAHTPVTLSGTSVASEQAADIIRLEPRYLLPPPDLVVVLCHFTC